MAAYGLRVALGVGPAGADPRTSFDYTWVDAAPDDAWLDTDAEGWAGWDRWVASPRVSTLGDALLVGRVSVDDGRTWTYCDATPLDDGFALTDAPPVTGLVSACAPDPCQAGAEARCGSIGIYGEFLDGPCVLNATGGAVCDVTERYFSCNEFGEGCLATTHTCPFAAVAPTHPGEIVITEIMRNSSLAAPDWGEWIEITNASANDLDLASCVVSNASGQAASLRRVVPSLLAPAYEAILHHTFDAAQNGGLGQSPSAAFELGAVTIGDRDDVISLTCGGVLIDQVAYGADWPGTIGVAMQLSRTQTSATSNDSRSAWCAATAYYGALDDLGTPAWQNGTCQ